MSAAEAIRALMLDGRARTAGEIIRETKISAQTVRNELKALSLNGKYYSSPTLIRLPSPPTAFRAIGVPHDSGRGYLYRINPNARENIIAKTSLPTE